MSSELRGERGAHRASSDDGTVAWTGGSSDGGECGHRGGDCTGAGRAGHDSRGAGTARQPSPG